jgi:redox-sensitive bicupin YhaK (pirin superfamily)
LKNLLCHFERSAAKSRNLLKKDIQSCRLFENKIRGGGSGRRSLPASAGNLKFENFYRSDKFKRTIKMIIIRKPEDIFQSQGEIENGTFAGRWHFSFDNYFDEEYMQFGNLRVFNDDTLSPGAVWPLHPHSNIEVVTYCAAGEFRHEDQNGKGGILKPGSVQHTSVGRLMFHSEINNLPDVPMRFIQMWLMPEKMNIPSSVEQRVIEKNERTDKLLLLVSHENPKALKIFSDAEVYSSFLRKNKTINHIIKPSRGVYIYNLQGEAVTINNNLMLPLGAAKIWNEKEISITANENAELLLIDTAL